MTKNAELEKALSDLQERAERVKQKIQSTRDALYLMLVDTYAFYLEASKNKGWLEAKTEHFKASGYKVKSSDAPHAKFLLVLRLTHQKIRSDKYSAKLGTWARGLAAMEQIHKQRPYLFANNLRSEMFDYVKNLSMTGLVRELDDTIEETGGDKPPAVSSTLSKRQLKADERAIKAAVQSKQRQAHKAKALGTANLNDAYVSTPDNSNLAVLVGRVNADGTVDIIGTCDDKDIVEAATFTSVNTNEIQQYGLFGALAHAIHIHALPRKLHQRNARTNFFRKLDMKHDDDKPAFETVRVALLKNGEIVLSKARAHNNSSLTTIAKPKAKHTFAENYFLRSSDRYWIETQLLLEGQIAVWSSNDNELLDTDSKIKADKQITLTQTIDGREQGNRNLYFYRLAQLQHDDNTQPYVIESEFERDISWRLELSPNTVRTIYNKHLVEWMSYVNKRVHTNNNGSMRLVIHDDGIELQSYWNKELKEYSRTGAESTVKFGENDRLTDVEQKTPTPNYDISDAAEAYMAAEAKRISQNAAPDGESDDERVFVVKPVDMYQVFEVLAENYSGAVLEYATNKQLRIKHSDNLADYATYIPATQSINQNRLGAGYVKLSDIVE